MVYANFVKGVTFTFFMSVGSTALHSGLNKEMCVCVCVSTAECGWYVFVAGWYVFVAGCVCGWVCFVMMMRSCAETPYLEVVCISFSSLSNSVM